MLKLLTLSTATLAIFITAPALSAQDENAWQLDADVFVSHDLLDRGLTMTSRDISLGGSIIASKKDFFAGVYVANPTNGTWYEGQMELFAGLTKPLGAWDLTITGELDSFHGGDYTLNGLNIEGESRWYPGMKASLSRDYGLAFVQAGTSWSSKGTWYHQNDTFYQWFDLEVPFPNLPWFTLLTHAGYDFRNNNGLPSGKDAFDWSVGVSGFIKDYELTLTYSNSSDDRFDYHLGTQGNGRIIAGFRAYF